LLLSESAIATRCFCAIIFVSGFLENEGRLASATTNPPGTSLIVYGIILLKNIFFQLSEQKLSFEKNLKIKKGGHLLKMNHMKMI
jgi:hypothetical protein